MINIFDKEFRSLDDLVGLTVLELETSDDNQHLSIRLKDSFDNIIDTHFVAYAMCCSQSWIESIEGKEDIIGNEIINIIEHNLPSEDTSDNELLQFYNYEIITSQGSCVIDFRNSSNGYYGGSLDLMRNSIVKTKAL